MRQPRIQLGETPRPAHRDGLAKIARRIAAAGRRGRSRRDVSRSRPPGAASSPRRTSPRCGTSRSATRSTSRRRRRRCGCRSSASSANTRINRARSSSIGRCFTEALARRHGRFLPRLSRSLAPSARQVKEAILARFSGNRRMFVLSNDEVRRYVKGLTDQWFTHDLGADRHRHPRRRARHRQLADRVDRRSAPRARACCGRSADLRSQVRWTIWMEALGIGARQRAARARRSARCICTACWR